MTDVHQIKQTIKTLSDQLKDLEGSEKDHVKKILHDSLTHLENKLDANSGESSDEKVHQDMRDAASELEVSHPNLTIAIEELIHSLSQMGI